MIEVEEANGLNSKDQKGHRYIDVTNKPMPTIQQSRTVKIRITPPHNIMKKQKDKPPYKVPSMAEIEAIPWNGFNVVSTFSGAGGSCLGYRMAGFRVLWANEFVEAAQEVYKLNHPNSFLDARDIRRIQPNDILEKIGLGIGDIDIFDGSPPCASFSTAGKREAGWGKVKKYSDKTQRVDDLFFEYTRLLEGLQPKVFVAENVSGLVKGTAKGFFKIILRALKDCGYNVKAKVLDARWLGVPQARQRLIFVGVRNDLSLSPAYPSPLPYLYTVRDALPWIDEIRKGGAFGEYRFENAENVVCDTVGTSPSSGNNKDNTAFAVKTKAIHDTKGQFSMGEITDKPSPTVTASGAGHWIIEKEASMEGYAVGPEWEKLKPGESSDRYFNLVKPDPDKPAPTVTQAGGFPNTASVTHPTEKRKFSIAELKRICAFPDDFQLTGSYAKQWERLGRAVPPVMMCHIAATVRDEILSKCAK